MSNDYISLESWQQLMQGLNFSDNEKCFDLLINAYSEKHRYYHNTVHLNAVLAHLNEAQSLTNAAHEIALALWFHDAVYKPLSRSNEVDSAVWAKRFLLKNNADTALINKIYNLVIATQHGPKLIEGSHESIDSDEQLIVDIDLSILGCSAEQYVQFEQQVRKEYRIVPSFIYKKKRKAVLQSFLSREKIYSHAYFYDRYEEKARQNISRAIQAL